MLLTCFRSIGIAIVALGATAAWARPFKVNVTPLFTGSTSEYVSPLSIEIQNLGPHAQGVVRLISGASETVYPVELPSGSTKQIVVTPSEGSPRAVLETNQGSANFLIPERNAGFYRPILQIGGSEGDLLFVSLGDSDNPEEQTPMIDFYCVPEAAPERSVGYSGQSVIVLASGSERLSDAAVQAISQWVMLGGKLLFQGGASAAVLRDPRWADLLPISPSAPRALPKIAWLETFSPIPAGPITVMDATAKPGMPTNLEQGLPLVASRLYGLGTVHYVAFDLTEPPLSRWEGRKLLFDALFPSPTPRWEDGTLHEQSAQAILNWSQYELPYSDSEFDVALFSTSTVALILGLYVLCVIPLNFAVLKKLGKREWAWMTAPILSVLFASIFFSAARGLYRSQLSFTTRTLVISDAGSHQSIAFGNLETFFPKAGRYPVQFEGLEQLSLHSNDSIPTMPRTKLQLVDDGMEPSGSLTTQNLTFSGMQYQQRLSHEGPWAEVRLQGDRYVVQNRSPHRLKDVKVILGTEHEVALGTLEPGAASSGKVQPRRQLGSNDWVSEFPCEQAFLLAELPDWAPGPQWGARVGGGVQLVMSTSLPLPKFSP